MRVVFMGTPEFAVPSLRALAETHTVLAAYTQPDRPRGRGRTLIPSPVKSVAVDLGIPVRQPASLADPLAVSELANDRCDAICVAAYGMILPPQVLELPRLGCLNVHASLLPEYRGAAPIHHAILDGKDHTGVTIMRMEPGLDTGPYADSYRTAIGTKSLETLETELAQAGANLLLSVLDDLDRGSVAWVEQDDAVASYAPKVTSEDVRLSPELDVSTAMRRVRASTRSARAKISLGGCLLDITNVTVAEETVPPGVARVHKHKLALGFSDGALVVHEVRPPGKACMRGCDWARGARVADECRWSAV